MATINITGTGGIIEGNLGAANVNVNLDPVYGNFNGSTSSINAGSPTMFDDIFAGAGTIMAWIYPKSDGEGNFGRIFDKNQWVLNVRDELSGFVRLNLIAAFSGDDGGWKTTDRVVPLNAWSHIAIVYDGSSDSNDPIIYVNGVAQTLTEGSTPTGSITSDASSDLYIGNNSGGTRTFDGYMMDVKIYKAAGLSSSQIPIAAAKINQDPDLISPNPPKGWYKFNASTTADSSGNGNTASASNMGSVVYDEFSVDVYDNSTTTDGTFTVTQGKVEGLALSSVDLNGTDDFININNDLESWTESAQKTFAAWVYNDGNSNTARIFNTGFEDAGSKTAFGLGMTLSTVNKPYAFLRDTSAGAIQQEFGDIHSNNTWVHYVIVQDGANNQAFLYQNGVLQATVSNVGEISQTTDVSAKIGVHWVTAQSQYFNGKVRDLRLYDYDLSDEQVASLYSATYPQTPLHYWKLDEGYTSGTTANTAGAFEDSGTGTDYDAQGSGLVNASCVNGTLDLDGTLTIAANGTLSAPRGNLDLANVAFAKNASGTFTHNNGNVKFSTAGGSSITTSDPVLYDLEVNQGGSNLDVTTNLTIEHNLTVTSGMLRPQPDTKGSELTITFGTTSYASQLELDNYGIGFESGGNNTHACALVGASSLYPFKVLSSSSAGIDLDSGGSSSKVKLANIDYDKDITSGGGGVTVTLTGDAEFNAFTVSSGDTLDINGQRVKFGGDVTYQGTIDADGLLVFQGGFTKYGTLNNAASGDIMTMSTSGFPTFSYITGYRTFFANGGVQLGTGGFTSIPTAIIASGELKTGTRNTSATNLTIATGGEFNASGNTHTISEDFTTSGGLIGKSALNLTGAEEVTGTDNLDEVATSNRVTVEAWFKATTDANYRAIFSRGTSWSTGNIYLYMNGNGNVQFSMNDLGATVTSTTAALADGKWHHAAATYDQTNLKLYIDGKLEASSAYTNPINTQTNGFKIGDRSGANWEGQIGRVSIWDAALTEAQIREMLFYDFATADSEATIPDANCIGWWQFDEGTGTAVADSSTNNADGTLNSAAWAGAGTLTYGTSTVDMTGNGTWTYQGDFSFYNFKVGAASKTTTYKRLSSGTINIANNLYIGAGSLTRASSVTWRLGYDGATSSRVNTGVGSILSGATDPIDFSSSYVAYFNDEAGTFNSNVKVEYLITSYPLALTNSLEATGYLWASNNLLDIADQTCTTPQMRMNNSASAAINIDGGTLNLTSTSSGAGFRPNFPNNTFTAGPGATVIGPAGKAFFESQNNFVIVGKAENLNVTNEELSVTGQVINCTGDIIQQFPTIDHDQQLDFDTADDRDIILGRDLDKNTELINS